MARVSSEAPLQGLDPKYIGDTLLEHFEEYASRYLRIIDKQSRLIPLVLNTTQKVVVEEIRKARAAGIPPRLICLKSRQVGISTLCEALMFYDAHANQNRRALVLAHKDKLSRQLFAIARLMRDELPPELKWKAKFDSATKLQFASTRSQMQVEAVGEARGYTSQVLLLSEFAYFPEDLATLRAVMQAAPKDVNTLVVIESTANGAGNAFHKLWVTAIGDRDNPNLDDWERGWRPIFVPWHKHEEYVMKPWFLPQDTSQIERVLAKRYKLNMRQLAWRRWCIKNNCDGNTDAFNEAYPAEWKDAFLLSGRPVFHAEAVRLYQSRVPPELQIKLPDDSELDWEDKVKHIAIVVPTERGRARQYARPIPRHTYIVGVDPSEGDPKSDPSPMSVLDQMTLGLALEWWGRLPPDLLAEEAMKVGWLYQWGGTPAQIIFEANNQGIDFGKTLQRAEYPNVYYRTTSEESVAGEVTKKPGWFQTNKNKHYAINIFRRLVREKMDEHRNDETRLIPSPRLVSEMSTLIYKDGAGGSTLIEAQPGHFKDLVMAHAIALAAHAADDSLPLEPLPIEDIENEAIKLALLRERDPVAAEEYSLAFFGMTCDDFERVSEARHQDQLRREAMGLGAMR
jgi:hypothetical protein